MHSQTKRRYLEWAPCWVVLGILALSCGQTTRDYDDDGSNEGLGGRRPIPVPTAGEGPGSGGGTDGTDGAAGAAGSAGGDPSVGGQGAVEPEPEPEPKPEPEPPVYPSDCTRTSLSVKDPNTGITWTTGYRCGNDGGAHVYEKPSYQNDVGWMDSTTSWFVCWSAGQQHEGDNNIWYYTQGDHSTAGWGGRAAWGFMPAINVYTQHDPDSAIPECTF